MSGKDASPSPGGTLFLRHTRLILVFPDGRQETLEITKNNTNIGRDSEYSDMVIPREFTSISRKHMQIRREAGKYTLQDMGSANGVFLNGKKVQEAVLKDKDEIVIGLTDRGQAVRITFEIGTEGLLGTSLSGETPQESTPELSVDSPEERVPYLRLRWPNGQVDFFPIEKGVTLVGRSEEADLRIPEDLPFVSSRQFEIHRDDKSFTIIDLKSTNGTFVNDSKIQPETPVHLFNNVIIRVGDESFGISLGLTFYNPLEQAAPSPGLAISAPAMLVPHAKEVLIGRAAECDIRLEAPNISRHHAVLQEQNNLFILQDLHSLNGTFVNNQPIRTVELHDGDLIEIGDYRLTFQDGKITPYQSTGMRLDVTGLSKDVRARGKKLRILDDVNMSILSREFVGVVGGSGAGKTTLLNALIGIRPGTGKVHLNGYDFYKEFEHFRSQMGYVPQSDILHMTLTVEQALDYAARLRLPASITPEERKQRITTVLETVSMNTVIIRKTRIGNLSGGQRKRVSIAAELLADPKLIYLDEATSGLDPGLEKKMMHTLRRLADAGRTVVLVTHSTNNIVQTDHVAFLSQGRLIFFGPSQEALDFFEVRDFADIYGKIEQRGEEWRQVYQKTRPDNYKKYVVDRQLSAASISKRELPKIKFGIKEFFRQFFVLTMRSLSVLLSDPITLGLLLLLLPLTGMLQLVIGTRDVLTGNLSILANPVMAAKTILQSYTPFPHTNTFVFVMGLEAVLTGLFVPSNDLVKERSIYLRERMVNLRVAPYLLSKAAIYSLCVIIQVVLYLGILSFGVNFPANGLYFPGFIELFITLFLTMLAGISFGLIISAVSKSTEMAIYLLTIMLFFQFFFAGTVFDLRGNTFEPLSYLSTTRWSLTALGVTVDMPKIAGSTILCSEIPAAQSSSLGEGQTICRNYPEAKNDLMLNYDRDMLLKSWGVLLGMTLLFMIVTGVLLERTRAG